MYCRWPTKIAIDRSLSLVKVSENVWIEAEHSTSSRAGSVCDLNYLVSNIDVYEGRNGSPRTPHPRQYRARTLQTEIGTTTKSRQSASTLQEGPILYGTYLVQAMLPVFDLVLEEQEEYLDLVTR